MPCRLPYPIFSHFWARAIFVLVIVFSIACCLPAARAQNIHFSVMSSVTNGDIIPTGQWIIGGVATTGQTYVCEIDITVTQIQGVNLTPAKTVPTFCIQLNQDVSLGVSYTTYTIQAIKYADGGTLSNTSIKDLTELYYLYYQGNSSTMWSNTTATAFQLAAWKVTQDSGNYVITGSSAGSTFYNNGWNPTDGSVALAQTWLTAIKNLDLSGSSISGNGLTQPVALTDPTYQDLMYTQAVYQQLVPFRACAWPGAILLAGIGFFRIRNRLRISTYQT